MNFISHIVGQALVVEGEFVEVVHIGGFAWKGTLVSITPSLIRVQPNGEREFLINPAHVAGINVSLVEA